MITVKSTAVLFASAIVMGLGIKAGSDLYSWMKLKVLWKASDREMKKAYEAELRKKIMEESHHAAH